MHGMVLVCSSLIHARLCDSVDSHPPGSSVHGILQTRILEWVTIPFPRGSSPPRDQTQVTHIACSLYIIFNKYLLNEWNRDWGLICLAGIAIKQIIVKLKDMKGGKREQKPAAAAAKSLQSCLTVRSHRRQPTTLPRPWDSPGKNTGVGCLFLLHMSILVVFYFTHSEGGTWVLIFSNIIV